MCRFVLFIYTLFSLFYNPVMSQSRTIVSGWLDIQDFGATGNDSTDDTHAIKKAAEAMKTGSVLYFPPGTYYVNSVITFANSGIVAGVGMERSIIRATTATMSVFSTMGTSGRIIFRDFKIEAAVKKTHGAGILLTNSSAIQQHARIENIWIDSQYRGIEIGNAAHWTIRDCAISKSVADGIKVNVTIDPDAGDNLITGCVIDQALEKGLPPSSATGNGIFLQTGATKIIGNKILSHSVGILVEPANPIDSPPGWSGIIVDVLVANNSIENQGKYGMLWQTPISRTAVNNSHILGNQLGGQIGNAAIAVSGNIHGVVVNDNMISIREENVIGIQVSEDGKNTPSQFTIVGNNITGNGKGIVARSKQAAIYGNWVGTPFGKK